MKVVPIFTQGIVVSRVRQTTPGQKKRVSQEGKMVMSDAAAGRPIKLLVFAQSLPGRGTDRALVRLLQHWDTERISPTLVLAQGGGRFTEQVPSHVEVIDLGMGDRKTSRAFFKVLRILRRLDPDCVLGVHTPPSRVVALARLFRPRLRVICLEADPFFRNESDRGFFWLRRLVTNLSHKLAAQIIAVSEVVTEDLHYIGVDPHSVVLIPHPCVDDELQKAAKLTPSGPPYSLTDGLPIILSVGNMFREKGQETLVRAMACLSRKRDAHLVVVGEGPLRGELESLASKLGIARRTWFLGFQENPFMYMAHSDVFVSASVSEGFDIAQIEAMACGVPVVVTDAPRYKAIEDGVNGSVVPTGDPDAMADALDRLLGDPALGASFVEKARETAEMFTAERIAGRYERVIMEVVERRRRDAE